MPQSAIVEIDRVGRVLFERSSKAKHLSISVKPFKGVRVAVPEGLSFSKAEEFVNSKIAWIQKSQSRMKQYELNSRKSSSMSDNIDRTKAKKKITQRLEYLADKHGFTYNRIFIGSQKTRWGSCSYRNNISLNIKITRLPEELMDYVILHELTHTRIKNHSDKFWKSLDMLVGDARKKAKSLKQFGIGSL